MPAKRCKRATAKHLRMNTIQGTNRLVSMYRLPWPTTYFAVCILNHTGAPHRRPSLAQRQCGLPCHRAPDQQYLCSSLRARARGIPKRSSIFRSRRAPEPRPVDCAGQELARAHAASALLRGGGEGERGVKIKFHFPPADIRGNEGMTKRRSVICPRIFCKGGRSITLISKINLSACKRSRRGPLESPDPCTPAHSEYRYTRTVVCSLVQSHHRGVCIRSAPKELMLLRNNTTLRWRAGGGLRRRA